MEASSHASSEEGAPAADLIPVVYDELRRLAAHRLAGESHEHTLQPTALVHEAWLRLSSDGDRKWQGRQQFFATAAEAMRRILVDRARRRQALKRGAAAKKVDLDDVNLAAPMPDEELLNVSEALEKLAAIDPQKAELVKLRYFAGLTFEEAAEVLNVSVPTVNRWWAFSRAWLLSRIRQMSAGEHDPRPGR